MKFISTLTAILSLTALSPVQARLGGDDDSASQSTNHEDRPTNRRRLEHRKLHYAPEGVQAVEETFIVFLEQTDTEEQVQNLFSDWSKNGESLFEMNQGYNDAVKTVLLKRPSYEVLIKALESPLVSFVEQVRRGFAPYLVH